MTNTALHRKLEALGAVTPAAIEAIARKVDAGMALQLSAVQSGVQANFDKADTAVQDGLSKLEQSFVKGLQDVLVAVSREETIGAVSKESFGVLIALNLVEGIATDQTPDLKPNNAALEKLGAGGEKSAFSRWSESLKGDAALQQDFAKAFRKFDKGDATERAARCVEIHSLRGRVLRHFQEAQVK